MADINALISAVGQIDGSSKQLVSKVNSSAQSLSQKGQHIGQVANGSNSGMAACQAVTAAAQSLHQAAGALQNMSTVCGHLISKLQS